MRKKIIICALSVLLLILSGVLAFYLHGQNRPIAGLSGDNRTLLRVWMLHSPGGAARWVETQLSAYERQHPGVLIYLRQVSADELTAEETLLPDVVLYRPGDIPDPDGLFLPISGDAPIFAGLLSGGRQVAYPLCWGAWVLAVDSAYDPQTAATPAPTTLLGRPSSTLSPEQTPALFPLEKADAANCPLLSPGGCALYALREIFVNQAYPRWTNDFAQQPSDTVYQRFRERKCASAMLTTGQVVAFSGLTSAGKGFPFRVMVGRTVTTEQVLLSSICAGAQDGAADLLSFLVSRGAQEQMRAVRPAGNFRESGVPALDERLRAAAVRHGVSALPGAEMRVGDADDGTSGGVFGADERGQGLSVPGDGRADGHDGAGAAFVDLRGCAGWRSGLAVVSRKPGRTGAAGASRVVFGAGGFGAVPVGLGGGGGAGGAAGHHHAGCVPVGRGFAAKSMAGLSVIVLPLIYTFIISIPLFPAGSSA